MFFLFLLYAVACGCFILFLYAFVCGVFSLVAAFPYRRVGRHPMPLTFCLLAVHCCCPFYMLLLFSVVHLLYGRVHGPLDRS